MMIAMVVREHSVTSNVLPYTELLYYYLCATFRPLHAYHLQAKAPVPKASLSREL